MYQELGLKAVRPKRNTSKKHPKHPVYPYLLKGIEIHQPNQVWSADITYLKVQDHWAYLVALLDWFSRLVINWQLAESMHSQFCVENLAVALDQNEKPEIHNSDQGSQFTAHDYVDLLVSNDIKVSMDGRGSYYDNIMTERLWRTVKYEEVYLKEYRSIADARQSLTSYFNFYNTKRLHAVLNYQTPAEVHFKSN